MKIGIVGAGQVGATAAYSMMMRRVGSEVGSSTATPIWRSYSARYSGRYAFCGSRPCPRGRVGGSRRRRKVVLAAGTNQARESRPDLLSRNAEIFAEIVPVVLSAAPDPIFLVATNPVHVVTQIVTMIAGRGGVASERVIGSGPLLAYWQTSQKP